MLFNFLMGAFGRGIRENNFKMLTVGVFELLAGLYFMIAAIGST